MFNRIPPISDGDLASLGGLIKPLAKTDNGTRVYNLAPKLRFGTNCAYRTTVFTRAALRKPSVHYSPCGGTITYHQIQKTNPGSFEPTVADVIAQLRGTISSDKFVYVAGFSCDTNVDTRRDYTSDSHHYTKTTIYCSPILRDDENYSESAESNAEIECLIRNPTGEGSSVVAYLTHNGYVSVPNYQLVRPGDKLVCTRAIANDKRFEVGAWYVADSEPFLQYRGACDRCVRFTNGAIGELHSFGPTLLSVAPEEPNAPV